MSLELGMKKAGLPLIRSFIHSIEGIQPALPETLRKKNTINYKFKTYQNGKTFTSKFVSTLENSFPCRGDKK